MKRVLHAVFGVLRASALSLPDRRIVITQATIFTRQTGTLRVSGRLRPKPGPGRDAPDNVRKQKEVIRYGKGEWY